MRRCPAAHQAFKAAVTAMCVSALIETGGSGAEVGRALDRGEAWIFEHLPKVRRSTPDTFYNVWAHAYSIQALVRMLGRKTGDADRRGRILALIQQQIDMLDRYEVVNGGWAYYDLVAQTKKPSGSTISFVTAAVLVSLHEARQAGAEVPQRLIDRGMASIRRQRKPDFSYLYGEYLKYQPMRPINRPGGSLGRSQACNVAMRLWGDPLVTDAVLRTWLDRLFAGTCGSTSAGNAPFPTSRGSRWPAISSTSATIMRHCASSNSPRPSGRRFRTNWPTSCCVCRRRTAPGGISPCSTTTSSTGQPLR